MDVGELVMPGVDNSYHEPTLKFLADCLPQLVWTCTATGACDFVNAAWLAYTGLPASQLLDKQWLERVHADDRAHLLESWRCGMGSTAALSIEFRIKRHDGVYRWFDIRLMPMGDAASQPIKWLMSGTDIQEVVEARHSLLQGKQQLRDVFDAAPVSITLEDWSVPLRELRLLVAAGVSDFNDYFDNHPEFVERLLDSTRLIDANEWALQLFRAEHKEAIVGNSLRWLFASPGARAEFLAILSRIASGVPPAMWEMELCAMDGQPMRVLSNAIERSPEAGQRVVLVSRVDITEFHRVDAELREQRVLLQRMSSLAKVGGWVHEAATGRFFCTDEMARIHGLPAGVPVTAEDTLAVFSKTDRAWIRSSLLRAVDHAEPFEFELPIETANRESKWLRARAVPIIEHGKLVRVEGVVQDITERKLAELEVLELNASLERQVEHRTRDLQRARHDLQSILDDLPTMIAYWGKDLRLRFANRAYQKMVGLDAQPLQGAHFTEIMSARILEERLPRMRLALQGQLQHFESSSVALDGRPGSHVQIHYRPDIVDAVVQGVYVLIIDVTSLKQAEDGLRAANRELEAFAYAVAHDLRAPLRAMSGFSTALLEDYGAALAPEAKDFAQEINHASVRMGELLDGLLTLSRSTQGEMRRDRVDLTAIGLRLLGELQRQEPDRQVQWLVAPDMVAFGDPRMLEVVLRNLLGNAWKYTGQTTPAQIRFDTVHRDGIWQFRVSDNGAGFNMAHADRLFKPFQRLHRQDEFAGIGIGLATVRRIVHRHGGEISAEAVPGKGARFSFTLDSRLKQEDA